MEREIEILRVDPKIDLKPGREAYKKIASAKPEAIFHYGWSWLVPKEILDLCPNVTLHPGKLPKDRGGSPIQNQILNGETWTYANVLKMSEGLDEGPVYLKEKISLLGDSCDEIWARMTATGAELSKKFLEKLAEGNFMPIPQAEETPTFYRRIKSDRSELLLGKDKRETLYNKIRALSETDPNTYVHPAFIPLKNKKLVVERAKKITSSSSLREPTIRIYSMQDIERLDPIKICSQVNNEQISLLLVDTDGAELALERIYLSA